MKPLIVYQSKTGNTQIIANAISSVLSADILHIDDVTSTDFENRKLVGLGSGIYWTMIDKQIYEAAALIPKTCKTFVFITSGMGFTFMRRLYWYYINKSFEQLDIKLTGSWECRGYDKHPLTKWMAISKGRPNRSDVESAKQFAMKLRSEQR